MEEEYLIDTNVIIDYMSERFAPKALDHLDKIFNTAFYISIINKIELLGFKNIIFLHDGIVEETISIRKKHPIKLPDAIIAASAISTNAILVTRNTEDFVKIAGLKLLNPTKLK